MTPDWQTSDGSVRLYCGDCLDVLPTLGKVDAVVTDPPYGVGLDYSKGVRVYYGNEYYESPTGYRDSWDECKSLLHRAFCLILPITKGGVFVSSSKWEADLMWLQCSVASPVWKLVWFKGASDTRSPIGWKDYETVYVLKKPLRQMHDHFYCNAGHNHVNRELGHPCPKPTGWAIHLVSKGTNEPDTILDPFMGSGTTGVACVRLGRKFIGIEKERKYFDIAVKRITKELDRLRLFEPPPVIVQRNLFQEQANVE